MGKIKKVLPIFSSIYAGSRKCSKLTLYNVFSPVIWFLCRQDWMDEPSPRGDTGGVYGEDGVEQAGRVSESD